MLSRVTTSDRVEGARPIWGYYLNTFLGSGKVEVLCPANATPRRTLLIWWQLLGVITARSSVHRMSTSRPGKESPYGGHLLTYIHSRVPFVESKALLLALSTAVYCHIVPRYSDTLMWDMMSRTSCLSHSGPDRCRWHPVMRMHSNRRRERSLASRMIADVLWSAATVVADFAS